jgi:hypothetical protein
LGYSPINLNELYIALEKYPIKDIAKLLIYGFTSGINMNYSVPKLPLDTNKLKCVLQYHVAANERVQHEITLGRIARSFRFRTILNLRSSRIGLIPKKTSDWSLITHLYYPYGYWVTEFLDETLATVQYSKCNNIISIIQTLGEHAKIGKIDIKSAFRPVPCYPGDFDLLGCIIGYMYYNNKCMPIGCSITCSTFQQFSTFLQWLFRKYMD